MRRQAAGARLRATTLLRYSEEKESAVRDLLERARAGQRGRHAGR